MLSRKPAENKIAKAEEAYTKDDLQALQALYQNPRNKGAVYSNRKAAIAHLKKICKGE